MQVMHFILDKILKLLTYYTPFSVISRWKVIWSQKQACFFWPTLYNTQKRYVYFVLIIYLVHSYRAQKHKNNLGLIVLLINWRCRDCRQLMLEAIDYHTIIAVGDMWLCAKICDVFSDPCTQFLII